MKKVICSLFLLALSSLCQSEDGLVVQFHIEEYSTTGQKKSSYMNAVLMRFGEEHSFTLENLYTINFFPVLKEDRKLNLITTLKEFSDGKTYYVGTQEIELMVGESETIKLKKNDFHYKIKVDTSYGKLP